jgi:hypothetical protein
MRLNKYRYWFYAAALYNLLWGSINILFPDLFFNLIKMPPPEYSPIWQVVGMFVLVYAPAYWWAGRYPERYPHFIVIGLLGKILGPIGFIGAVLTQQLPLAFGWTIIINDLIWWIPFSLYLREVSKSRGGILRLLLGD